MTDTTTILLRSVHRVPYYHSGIGHTLLKPPHGEGTFSVKLMRITVGPVEERLFEGRVIRAAEVRGNALLSGAWLDIDATPGLREHLKLPPPSISTPRKLIL